MKIQEAISLVNSKFIYTPDLHKWFDRWRIMHEDSDGHMRGDCEDYSLTVMWYACDRRLLRFLWKVIISHEWRLYTAVTRNNAQHAVGYADGLWFDNWSKKALPEKEFFDRTQHELGFPIPMPFTFIPFIVGAFTRKRY